MDSFPRGRAHVAIGPHGALKHADRRLGEMAKRMQELGRGVARNQHIAGLCQEKWYREQGDASASCAYPHLESRMSDYASAPGGNSYVDKPA